MTSTKCFECGKRINRDSSYRCNACTEDLCLGCVVDPGHKIFCGTDHTYENPEDSIHSDQK